MRWEWWRLTLVPTRHCRCPPARYTASFSGLPALPSMARSMKHVACVRKRFRTLCLAPQLVHNLRISIHSGSRQLARCEALLAFLAAHGQHVQTLRLHVGRPVDGGESPARLTAAVASCLGACGASGSLQQLVLSAGTPVSSYAWLSGLTGLRLLHLGEEGAALQCPPGITRLQCLGELILRGSHIDLGGVRLPPSLSKLEIQHDQTTKLPSQVCSTKP